MTTTTRRHARLTADRDRAATAPGGAVPWPAVPGDPGHRAGTRRPGGRQGGRRLRRGVVALLVLGAGAWAVQGLDLDAVRGRIASGVARVSGSPTATGSVGAPGGAGDVTGLDAELQRRFDSAVAAAAADGVALTLTSGRRTAEEQQVLVDQAVARYGVPEAYRWVLPPDQSAHVRGLAVDVGPTDGALWLGEHGQELGLCRTYANEVWHFEMLPDGATTCPEQRPDSSWAW
ncbi:D-alanyl-D-alanine carboxypeptidase family protein [Cellulomonas sp. C5510]|uniref:D-alanyl-D-alanine carboxypeptidase family protein n=1 Tax=Cellulomonas sp. C5510 TaxID=2871170 RepID=UPI001C9611A9|nr:D-alanyl-D-alanine carboxypeptidase family protein [Cellulomonas sp. C5510]QZN84403.1 D-alanyl-D-alanine carboxypeptidase family protein [Cellulomonas sp. C5510]